MLQSIMAEKYKIMRNTPLKAFAGDKDKEDTQKKEKYQKIIKDHNMKKDNKGYWVDNKGRNPSQIAAGVHLLGSGKQQRQQKLPASNKKY